MRCAACGEVMARHACLEMWHCLTLGCIEFDRWHAVTEKLAARVITERADLPAALPPAPSSGLAGDGNGR